MPFKETIQLALNSLGANKLRSTLTMLGITIGVFSVISVMTATGALQSSIETGLTFLGSNIFQFAKYSMINSGGSASKKYENRHNISFQQANAFVRAMEGYNAAICLKVFDREKQATRGRLKTNQSTTLVGTNENFVIANAYNIDEGRNLNEGDLTLARNVTVIGKELEKRLFPNESPIGKDIKINGKNYTVIGTFQSKGGGFGGSQDGITIVPLTRYFEDFGSANRTVNIAIQPESRAAYERTLSAAFGAMRVARGLKPGDENDFEYYANDSLASAFAQIADTVRIGAFVISFIALIAAGIGIMNIMLVSVTERTKEIGVRKSIGARKNDILRQFLVEAVFLSLVGGLAGILFGVVGGNALAVWLKADVLFPYGWAVAGIAVCTVIGVGFGLYPAYKAASLDPIEALRFE
ncbi:ABC transporter [Verrucomicrobia bacterium SCGC AG-212-E04]|nr:ABC transporter [Verrucomicrobia bacterium SCGC AG-212-E04]